MSPDAFPVLEPGEVHLWVVQEAAIWDTSLMHECEELLSPEERSRASRFLVPTGAHQFVMARAALRDLLSRYHPSVEPREWTFGVHAHGKPFVEGPSVEQDLRFNVSHTDSLIVLAFARGFEVGVDVEAEDRGGDLLEIAERFFSASESRSLNALPSEEQGQRFYELWTLKEAYLKACGRGLTLPLDSFSISFPGGTDVSVSDGDPAAAGHPSVFWQYRRGNCTIAVAAHGPGERRISSWEVVPLGSYAREALAVIRTSRQQSG